MIAKLEWIHRSTPKNNNITQNTNTMLENVGAQNTTDVAYKTKYCLAKLKLYSTNFNVTMTSLVFRRAAVRVFIFPTGWYGVFAIE